MKSMEQIRENATVEIAKRMAEEVRILGDHHVDPDTYAMEINQEAACIGQQMLAEQLGIVNEEATEEPTDVCAPARSAEASEDRGNYPVPTHGEAF